MPSPPPCRARLRKYAFVAALTAGAFLAGATVGTRSSRATGLEDSPYAVVGQLARVLVQIENAYVDPVDRTKLLTGAVRGMVEGLDPHSSYMTGEELATFTSETEGHFGGVGVVVDLRGEQLTVVAPIEGSPAARAGVKRGDRVLSIDGEDIEHIPVDRLVVRMRGPVGTHVKLFVRRAGAKEPIVFDLVREVVKVPSVASKLLDGGIAYVKIRQFQEQTRQELVEAAARLRSRGSVRGVVLDLRGNPGGLVDQAAEVADEFLASGVIYTTRHRDELVEEISARPGGAFVRPPAAVLVDEWSASAAELLAGALQDNRRALIVGATTFGKGSVQSVLPLPGGAGLRLTTARYYTPSGRSIQAEGIHPDAVIEPAKPPVLVVRERNMEGHIEPGDPVRTSRPRDPGEVDAPAPAPAFRAPADAGVAGAVTEDAVEGSEASSVPGNPNVGADFALMIAYQAVQRAISPEQ